MKIVILCGPVYPLASATGACALRVAKEFSKKHDVLIFGVGLSEDSLEETRIESVKIKNVFDREMREKSKYSGSSTLDKTFYNLIRIKWIIKFIFQKYSVRYWLVDSYLHELEKYDDIDFVIPICCPFESLVAAMLYKEKIKTVKTIGYMFDEFVDARTTHYFNWNKKIKRKNNLIIENNVIKSLDYLFFVNQNKIHLQKEYTADYFEKMCEVEHPLIEASLSNKNKLEHINVSEIKCIYAGNLKINHIDPRYFINVLNELKHLNINVTWNIYSNKNFKKYFSRYKYSFIEFNEWIPRNELFDKLSQSDILINIAVKDGHQISSKIFEYMSLKKPIIHVYSNNNDRNLIYLKKYPLALCIQDKISPKENAKKINNWLKAINDINIHDNFMYKEFYDCTAEHIAKLFLDKMYEIKNT